MLLRAAWISAAADPGLLEACPPSERAGFAIVGALVIAQCALVGTGAAEALLLASHGDLGAAGPMVFLTVGSVLAIFWASVVRLSLVNMGGRIAPSAPAPTGLASRFRAAIGRQVPNLARLVLYGGLGVVLAFASMIPLFRVLGMLQPSDAEGVLTLGRELAAHGGAMGTGMLLLLLVFLLPIAMRAYLPSLAHGTYERLHQAQLRAVVQRESAATLRVWSASMAGHGLDPIEQRRKQRLDDLLLLNTES